MEAHAADATLSAADPAAMAGGAVERPGFDVLREMARGGLAGLLVGIVVCGIGGRLLMRAAALLEPEAAGLRTENGNVIGEITFGGTLALLIFGGLLTGTIIGSLWVVIRPWLPRRPVLRALAAMPIAVAMGTTLLVQDTNPDFILLRRNLVVVAALLALVALTGPSMVLAEAMLDRVLPVVHRRGPALIAYGVIDAVGALLVLGLVVPLYLLSPLAIAGIAFVIAGIGSVAHWVGRLRGGAQPPWLAPLARGALTVGTLAGLAVAIPEVLGAGNLG